MTKKNTKKNNSVSSNFLKYENNKKIIEVLEIFAKYYTIINNRIHQNSYQKAIYNLKRFNKNITSAKDVKDVEGIGKGMLDKIDSILKTGTHPDIASKKMLEIISQHANTLDNLMGFGPSLIIQLDRQYNIKTINNLDHRMTSKNPLKLSRIAYLGWKYHKDLSQMIPRDEITAFGKNIERLISNDKYLNPYKLEVELAGSYPSGKIASKDIDILIFYENDNLSENIMEHLVKLIKNNFKVEIVTMGNTKFMGLIKNEENKPYRHVDIAIYPKDVKQYAHLYFTSGKVFNLKIRQHAKNMGYKLSDTGLYSLKTGKKIKISDPVIPNLFKKLNLDYKLYLTRY